MFLQDLLHNVQRLEKQFERELAELKEKFPHHRYRRQHDQKMRLAFTSITLFNNQKIGGIIMNFVLDKDNPSVALVLQALDKDGKILPAIDSVTNHPTLKPGTIQITCDNPGIKISQSADDPTQLIISRADNVTTASGTLSAKATNDLDEEVDGSAVVNEVADPVVDNGIAASLQFAPAPVTAPAAVAQS